VASRRKTYGKIGVKAWIFRGEVLPTKDKEKISLKQGTKVLTSEKAEESSGEGVRKDVTTN
jgi:small subunit ribosomal protein S3